MSIILSDNEQDTTERKRSLYKYQTSPMEVQKSFWPVCTYLLMILNIGYFIWMVLNGVDLLEPTLKDLLVGGGNLTYLFFSGETWRLVSSIFVHAGIIHLLSNMLALYFLGKEFERLVGHRSFLIAYFGGGIIASINSMYWHNQVVMVGASGAIFAILGGLFAVIVTAEGRRIQRAQEKSSTWRHWMLFALISGFNSTTTDNAAHLGGLIGGFLLGLLLSRAYTAERLKSKIIPSWRTLSVVLVLATYFGMPFYFKPPSMHQFYQWYEPFEVTLVRHIQSLDHFNKIEEQKSYWDHTLKPKFKNFDHYFQNFMTQIDKISSTPPSVDILYHAKETDLTSSERSNLLAIYYVLHHLKTGFAKHLDQPLDQITSSLSVDTLYHLWMSRKYKNLILERKTKRLLDQEWDEALFFTQDTQFFETLNSANVSQVMNYHIWQQMTASNHAMSLKKLDTFIKAMEYALSFNMLYGNAVDTLATIFYKTVVSFSKNKKQNIQKMLTLSQHAHQMNPTNQMFTQQLIRFLLYAHSNQSYSAKVDHHIMSVEWMSKADFKNISRHTRKRKRKRKQRNKQSKQRTKILTLTIKKDDSNRNTMMMNQGRVIYAIPTSDLQFWNSKQSQQVLSDFTSLDYPLNHMTSLLCIYIPADSKLPIELPYANYEILESKDQANMSPLLLADPVYPLADLQKFRTSYQIKPSNKSSLELKLDTTQTYQVIYSQPLQTSPEKAYWTLHQSLPVKTSQ